MELARITLSTSQFELSEYEKDIWDVRKLGIEVSLSRSEYKLNFKTISQPWLRQAAKQYMAYSLSTLGYKGAVARLKALKYFSEFINEYCPTLISATINRSVIISFLEYLAEKGLAEYTRARYIGSLKIFLELCFRNSWADIPKENLIYNEDYPKRKKAVPKYIPPEVLEQLNRHLSDLPKPMMRMVLVLQECGMRVGELCTLSFNCISQDAAGDWWLKYYQSKFKKDHTISISKEVVAVIQEQQEYIKGNLGIDFKYLFCGRKPGKSNSGFIPKPEPMKQDPFTDALNKLAKEKNICDASGQLWHFHAHQFRHTVGTRMINSGVPIQIIKRYLGHESFDMTSVYAHLHDQTLKKEVAKYYGRVINIAGQVIESENPELETSDLQWFKRNVQAQALPNGSCARPVIKGSCPHANACLTCGDFRTTLEFLDQHKEQLKQTEKIIEKAKANSWQRQAEMNEQVKTNLQNIISALEVDNAR